MKFVAHKLSFILREDAPSADNAHRCLPTDSLSKSPYRGNTAKSIPIFI